MAGTIFFISDTHLFHNNILKFTKPDGTLTRPGFRDIHHMHEIIMENWAKVVRPQDKVYHLGDVTFHHDGLPLLRSLPGHKRLIRGNHDLLKMKEYATVFDEIYGVRQINGLWLSHVPMHPQSMERAKANIHGHLHTNIVREIDHRYSGVPDLRYINVCVEQINYTPVSIDEIYDGLRKKGLIK